MGFRVVRMSGSESNLNTILSHEDFSPAVSTVGDAHKCRQCLPAVYQQEASLTSGATQAEVLFAAPQSGTWTVPRDAAVRRKEGSMQRSSRKVHASPAVF